MRSRLLMLLALAGAVAAAAAGVAAAAGPTPGFAEVGVISPNEQQEIWANGNANCVKLDQASDAGANMTDAVRGQVERYRSQAWDWESSMDIVWESVTGHCPAYLDAVQKASRSYGDHS